MVSEVRPLARRARLCPTRYSLSLSSALVASSRMSTGGFFRNTRAMETRCFCPPESFYPALAHIGVVAVLQLFNEFMRTGKARGLLDVRPACARAAVCDVFSHRAGE